MKGTRGVSKEYLERRVLALEEENAALHSEIEELRAAIERRDRATERLEKLLKYYTNPDTPPSANSLEWKEEKRRQRKERRDEGAPAGKRGGQAGHPGVSRRRSPERVVRHRFGRRREGRRLVPDVSCGCGRGRMEVAARRVRDITEIRITAEETRHVIEVARCACGRTAEAPNDLPARGNFGRRFVGLVSEIRAGRVPLAGIARAVGAITGVRISGSTVNSIVARASDAMKPEADGILRMVERSPAAGFDETRWNDGGSPAYVNVAQSGDCIAISISGSRATLMLDTMDEFDGVAITDRYNAYDRFDAGGRHQTCWAHNLRETKHLAGKYGGAVPPEVKRVRQELHEDHQSAFHTAKLLAARGAHSPRLRHDMNRAMRDMMDGYRGRGSNDPDMLKVLDKLERQIPCMFAFLEHPGVDPTNNASERALRYIVVFRKIIGQTKGGPPAMRRLADFATCVLTWRRQGKSVYEEVARLI